MFIPSTAKIYGMQVDAKKDERLDVGIETDAAMRYLAANHLRFNDWMLAILAYNTGEIHLQEAIDQTGVRDAWKLVENGYREDPHYLARFMAAVIIEKNQSILNIATWAWTA